MGFEYPSTFMQTKNGKVVRRLYFFGWSSSLSYDMKLEFSAQFKWFFEIWSCQRHLFKQTFRRELPSIRLEILLKISVQMHTNIQYLLKVGIFIHFHNVCCASFCWIWGFSEWFEFELADLSFLGAVGFEFSPHLKPVCKQKWRSS